MSDRLSTGLPLQNGQPRCIMFQTRAMQAGVLPPAKWATLIGNNAPFQLCACLCVCLCVCGLGGLGGLGGHGWPPAPPAPCANNANNTGCVFAAVCVQPPRTPTARSLGGALRAFPAARCVRRRGAAGGTPPHTHTPPLTVPCTHTAQGWAARSVGGRYGVERRRVRPQPRRRRRPTHTAPLTPHRSHPTAHTPVRRGQQEDAAEQAHTEEGALLAWPPVGMQLAMDANLTALEVGCSCSWSWHESHGMHGRGVPRRETQLCRPKCNCSALPRRALPTVPPLNAT